MKAFIFHISITLILLALTCIGLLYNESCTIAFVIATMLSSFCSGVSLMVNIKDPTEDKKETK